MTTEGIDRLAHHRELPLFAGCEPLFAIEPTFGLVLHVTRTDDRPGELGSAGPIDAHIYPLLKGVSGDGLERERLRSGGAPRSIQRDRSPAAG